MKRNAVLCLVLCLCILFSALLSACTTPEQPEESSAPSEEGSVPPVPEDPNAKTVRAYLEELLDREDPAEWISPDRVEPIRESVKLLKDPILTKEDVPALAERAAAFYGNAVVENRAIVLPAYGPVRRFQAAPSVSDSYSKHAKVYNALLAYTFYLFTPPDAFVRGTLPASFAAAPSFTQADAVLCLPLASLAGGDTTRLETGCILLYPTVIEDRETLLDFSGCSFAADWVESDGCRTLGLLEMAGEGVLKFLDAPSYVRAQADRLLHSTGAPWAPLYDGEGVLMPFSPEEARGLREMADLCAEPYLLEFQMENLARLLQEDALDCFDPDLPILLPDADGTGKVLLDPKVMSQEERLRRVMAYTVDLFTPRAYRFTDLTDRAGTYYATGNWINDLLMSTIPEGGIPPDTPETMLDDFYAGGQEFVLVTEDFELYLINGDGTTEPLFVREDVTE